MKKKVLTLALLAILITIVVSSTLAYFTAEDEVTNTVTMGSVKIEIYENGKETLTDTVTFGRLIPVVEAVPSADKNYFGKVVEVKSTGKNAAYIRVHIAVPTALEGYLHLEISEAGWVQQGTSEAAVEGVAYTVYTYDHTAKVEPGDFTAELLQGAYLGSEVDIRDNPATAAADLEFCKSNGDGTYTFSGFVAHKKTDTGYSTNTVSILIAAQGMQDRGFTDATTALNTGFGENSNPWK